MQSPKPVILLTRPARQAAAFRQMLPPDIDVVVSPVIKIIDISVKIELNRYSALVFSSQNALLSAAKFLELEGRQAFAVGDRTAALAQDLGMFVQSAKGSGEELVAMIIKSKTAGRLLFLHGEYSTGNIQSRLQTYGLETDSIVIYQQDVQRLSDQAITLLSGDRPVILPVFSPRSSMLLAAEVQATGATAPLHLIAISDAARQAWDGPDPCETHVSVVPTAQAMAEEILTQFSNAP